MNTLFECIITTMKNVKSYWTSFLFVFSQGLLLSLDMSKLEKIEKERARKAEREGYQASGDTTNIVNTNRQYNFTGKI